MTKSNMKKIQIEAKRMSEYDRENVVKNANRIFEVFGYNIISKIIVAIYAYGRGYCAGSKNAIKIYIKYLGGKLR